MTGLAARIARAADEGVFLARDFGYRQFADLDGAEARRYLEAAGFEVISNRDTGYNGEAITACGIGLSTNGYCWRQPTNGSF